MNPIVEYWNQIESRKVSVGYKIKRVYKKLVNDLDNLESEYEYDENKASHAIDFVEKFCKQSKGKMGGKPFKLELWQKAMTGALFGFVHTIDGTRKYREFILIGERKKAKSAGARAVGLYLVMADGEAGDEIVSVATTRDQAKNVWLESKSMIKKSPILNKGVRSLVSE